MPREFPYQFNEPFRGIVDTAGDLTLAFGPDSSVMWIVQQVSIEMPTAPAGATVEIRYMNSLATASPSARRGTAGGEPPITLQGGERLSVVWENCTPGDPGNVLVSYRKVAY